MADFYGQTVGKDNAKPKTMLLIGRITMVVATAIAVAFASMGLNILDLLVFVGALWGALVFPAIASFYWDKVTNKAFTVAVIAAVAVFLPVRFSWISMDGFVGPIFDIISVVGIGVVLGLMAFGFFGLRVGKIIGVAAALISAPFSIGFLHDYATLSGSLVTYAVSTAICYLMSARSTDSFDFALIRQRVGDFDETEDLDDELARFDESDPDPLAGGR